MILLGSSNILDGSKSNSDRISDPGSRIIFGQNVDQIGSQRLIGKAMVC